MLNKGTTDWGLNPRPPALEASTLPPLGYRGGGDVKVNGSTNNDITLLTGIVEHISAKTPNYTVI